MFLSACRTRVWIKIKLHIGVTWTIDNYTYGSISMYEHNGVMWVLAGSHVTVCACVFMWFYKNGSMEVELTWYYYYWAHWSHRFFTSQVSCLPSSAIAISSMGVAEEAWLCIFGSFCIRECEHERERECRSRLLLYCVGTSKAPPVQLFPITFDKPTSTL